MLILATDTSGKQGSIALAECDGETCEIVEIVPLTGGTFSAQLIPQISALLAKHNFTKFELGGFAVVSGPGSFTGLRVGLAAIKGLAEILGKPIAAVSLLEAVAAASRKPEKVLAALDAGRNELYVGEYETALLLGAKGVRSGAPESFKPATEKLISREELLQTAKKAMIVTPDQELADVALAHDLSVEIIERPRSDSIARIGWLKLQSGQTVSTEDLEANYIRRSDAEIFAKK